MFFYKTKVNEIQHLQLFVVYQEVFLFSPFFYCMVVVSAGRSVMEPFCSLPGFRTYLMQGHHGLSCSALFVLVPAFDWYQMVLWSCDLFLSWKLHA